MEPVALILLYEDSVVSTWLWPCNSPFKCLQSNEKSAPAYLNSPNVLGTSGLRIAGRHHINPVLNEWF